MINEHETESPSRVTNLKRDPLAIGLLATTSILLIALFIWITASYSTLPDLLPLHFDAQGNPDRIGERREVYVLPAIALVALLVNGLAGLLVRLRFGMVFASYLIWSGALMVQLLVWTAAWNILR